MDQTLHTDIKHVVVWWQVTKMIEDCSSAKVPRSAIGHDAILDWLVKNKVLSIALEGVLSQNVEYGRVKMVSVKVLQCTYKLAWVTYIVITSVL